MYENLIGTTRGDSATASVTACCSVGHECRTIRKRHVTTAAGRVWIYVPSGAQQYRRLGRLIRNTPAGTTFSFFPAQKRTQGSACLVTYPQTTQR
jgi:hypothetical protein